MSDFSSRRELLNPLFEGYKLSIIPQEDAVSYFSIDGNPASQSTGSTKTLLTFKEVQSRISHNHLTSDGRRALYVDAEFNVVEVNVDPFSYRVVYQLPKPIQSDSVDEKHAEYPSAAFWASSVVFVSDGNGSVFVLRTSDTGPYILISEYQIPDGSSTPFRIHCASGISPYSAIIIVSSRNYEPTEVTTSKLLHVDYDVRALKFDFDQENAHPPLISIAWHRRGEDVPLDVFPRGSSSHILLGASPYRDLQAAPIPSYDPTTEEMAPIPRANENLDTAAPIPVPPPPYSWTQTSDSLTIAYPVPKTIDRSRIEAKFTTHSLSLHIELAETANFPWPNYEERKLWAPIDASNSLWTLDTQAGHDFGLLTLHLEKQHEGTKWMQVFADSDEEVLETVDPSELAKIRESLEKYTASLREGEDLSGLGLGHGVSSLAEGEMDDEVDASIGKQACLTWVSVDGADASSLDQYPFRLLSTPLPGYPQGPSLIAKENLDGVVYTLDEADKWQHTSTFSALAFVLASKQDTRFVYHADNTVLAFESGSHSRGANVYVYRSSSPKEMWAKESVVQVGDGPGGSVLGVVAVTLGDGSRRILCLTENKLVVIRAVL